MKIGFSDGEKIGIFADGKKTVFSSRYIEKYKENAMRSAKNKEWKKNTDLMIEDGYYFDSPDETVIRAKVKCVSPTVEENKILYAFSVNDTSGIYFKYTDDENYTEAHYLSSSEYEFNSFSVQEDGKIIGAVQTDSICSNVAEFKDNGDFVFLTDGDSFDENPSYDKEGNILFNSYPVGRDANNAFVTYLPSEICRFRKDTMQIEELIVDEKYSYIKPIEDKDGNLYCIRKPGVEKNESNVFLEILLIPVRIVQAIVGFISAFVMCFAKKPMVNGQSARSVGNGGDAAKNGADMKKIWINNTLINVEKESKRNRKYAELGFIPKNWTLVRLQKNENGTFDGCREYELAFGVADFDLKEENGGKYLIYTNGKRVIKLTDFGDHGKKEPLFDTDFCLRVNVLR
ncbi:MAG: hypothetical protein IJX88_00715 [Clostridia bacterium]|nr:hypothetical protein [Clostridia bacterium]